LQNPGHPLPEVVALSPGFQAKNEMNITTSLERGFFDFVEKTVTLFHSNNYKKIESWYAIW
jgi:hypothetical protein